VTPYYYGASIGGFQGSSRFPCRRASPRRVLEPGAVWLNMIPRSINWIHQVSARFVDPDPLTQLIGLHLQTQFD
jgi:hypothetical protein